MVGSPGQMTLFRCLQPLPPTTHLTPAKHKAPSLVPLWVLTWAQSAGSTLNAVCLVRPTQPIQSQAVQGPGTQVSKHGGAPCPWHHKLSLEQRARMRLQGTW